MELHTEKRIAPFATTQISHFPPEKGIAIRGIAFLPQQNAILPYYGGKEYSYTYMKMRNKCGIIIIPYTQPIFNSKSTQIPSFFPAFGVIQWKKPEGGRRMKKGNNGVYTAVRLLLLRDYLTANATKAHPVRRSETEK